MGDGDRWKDVVLDAVRDAEHRGVSIERARCLAIVRELARSTYPEAVAVRTALARAEDRIRGGQR